MKVTCLLGSPRVNGNSSTIARKFCEALAAKIDIEVKYTVLNKLSYKGCQACDACKTTHEQCVLKDDLEDVLNSVKESDVAILASPIYFGEVTAQLKGFIDRTYSYIVSDYADKIGKKYISRLKPGTRFVMILSQKAGEEVLALEDIFPRYKFLFDMFLGIKEMQLIRGCNLDKKTDAANDSKLLKRVEAVAKNFLESL
jgi:multimeric flavodoxin WrbA